MAQILDIARKRTIKTKIMYGANLSFAQVNDYLSFLQEMGLLDIKTRDGRTIYKTTSKGDKYLETFAELKECIKNKSFARIGHLNSSDPLNDT